jgi:hypothetical protein
VNLTLAAPDAGVGLEGVGADVARALAGDNGDNGDNEFPPNCNS